MQCFGEPKGRVKIQMISKNPTFSFPQNSDLPRFLIFRAVGGNETRALFVLYEAVLDNNTFFKN